MNEEQIPAAEADADGAHREPKVIKRYTNRKLYDTVESRYVTLDEIAEMDHDRLGHGTRVVVLRNLVEHGSVSSHAAMDVPNCVDAQVRRQTARRRLEGELHLGSRAIMLFT